MTDYGFLKNSKTAQKWEKLGMRRRSGVAVPLFSVRSGKSIGIGEIPDIKLILKWCEQTGNSILQLLPLNDTGFDFAPYNSISSFALDPMYISIRSLKEVNLSPFKKEISELRVKFQHSKHKTDYAIKQEKVNLLWRIYKRAYLKGLGKFERYVEDNLYWLKDYALFKVLKHKNNNDSWDKWEAVYRERNSEALSKFDDENREKILFQYWIQWQLFDQMTNVKKYAEEKGIFIMGDIPYLVSRDSCDVWANRNYFELDKLSGAPPDMYFANGQRWGMPPYNRKELEKDDFRYFTDKLEYAKNFYDMYRIDHFVGFFRVWTIDKNEPEETGGLNGKFSPGNEHEWEGSGRKLLDAMISKSDMLPCAEDLGTVPDCSPRILWEYGIPGMDVQRWIKSNNNFIPSEKFRWLSIATVSTHDSSSLTDWMYNEAGTIDKMLFERILKSKGFTDDMIKETEEKLFNLENSHYNRLLWKEDIDTREKFLEVTGLSIEGNHDLAVLYDDSYGEKEKFIARIDGRDDSDKKLFKDGKVTTEFIREALDFISKTDSIFSIQLLQEYLCLDENFLRKTEEKSFRINFPGLVNDENWTAVLPISLEKMCLLKINGEIKEMNTRHNRA